MAEDRSADVLRARNYAVWSTWKPLTCFSWCNASRSTSVPADQDLRQPAMTLSALQCCRTARWKKQGRVVRGSARLEVIGRDRR